MKVSKTDVQEQLWSAAKVGDCGAIRSLIMRGADIDAQDSLGRTAFQLATQYGHSSAATTILAAKELKHFMDMGIEPSELLRSDEVRRNGDASVPPKENKREQVA